ncbi:MAG: tetrahydrofolate dehydrogenase/cyclohydrolase catalytic domain-containing protein, partial [Longimicrobiales bacterium]
MAKIISGTALSETIRAEIAQDAAAFREDTGVQPGLAVVIVGNDPASEVYVRSKGRAA